MVKAAMSVGDVAVRLGVSRSTVRRAVVNGLIPAWPTPGGHMRFDPAKIEDLAHQVEGGSWEPRRDDAA